MRWLVACALLAACGPPPAPNAAEKDCLARSELAEDLELAQCTSGDREAHLACVDAVMDRYDLEAEQCIKLY